MNITRNPASLHAATDIHEIAAVLRQTTEALTTASALLTDLIVSHSARPAVSTAAEALLDAMDETTAAIDAERKSLLDTADALAFDGEVAQ